MYNVVKVKTCNDLSLKSIITNEETSITSILGPERYKLFSDSARVELANRLANYINISENVDVILRYIKNDKEAKYERIYEIAFTIQATSKTEKPCSMDFTFELYKMKDEPEACDLMTYYMSEYKTDKE